ncbi:hypothetical protein FRC11_013060 [Ceratobasidium sp. 423]|nr:hypothetical protein FRC11_013060 [Ceratobasidium sp. 423]
MLDELTASTNLLCIAIERYYFACLAIQRSFARGENPHITTPHLPLRMDAEAQVVASLEVKLRKAKAALNWSRNCSNTHATVNDLPPEILARIFQIVHRAEPCAKRKYNNDTKGQPMYPATLSHVCSRWREVAFNTPSLWPHIDISTSSLLNRQRLDGLVQLHSNQAGRLPLDLHVFDSSGYDISLTYPDSISQVITQLASRIVSFDLDIMGVFDYDVHHGVLSSFFGNCTPGKLKRLTLVQHGDDHEFLRGHDESDDDDLNDGGLEVDPPTEQLENILSHISVLRLNRLYPQWSSRAYHGLVELRLTGSETTIAESELLRILRYSPDLRIFQFDLTIRNPLPANSQIIPVRLNHLEVLNLAAMRCKQLDVLLRWIVPGPKPLQFAVVCGHEEPGLQLKEKNIMSFFSRSRITRAYGKYFELLHILDLVNLSPNLQMLALRGTTLNHASQVVIMSITSERQLECLHLLDCSVDTELITSLLSGPELNIKILSFYRCSFLLSGKYISKERAVSHIEEQSRNHRGISLIIRDSSEPNPIESWDLFASHETSWAR